MKCEIIKDLLPLYCDKLTSQVSNEEIEKHLGKCEKCMSAYEKMSSENCDSVPDTNIEPLKKIRKKNILKIIAGFLSGVLAFGIVFVFAFVGVVPASADDISITYSGMTHENGDISIDFDISTKEGWCINSRGDAVFFDSHEDPNKIAYAEYSDTFYTVLKIPFDDRGEYPNECEVGFLKQKGLTFNEGDTYTVRLREGSVTYHLKDIAEELGLQ